MHQVCTLPPPRSKIQRSLHAKRQEERAIQRQAIALFYYTVCKFAYFGSAKNFIFCFRPGRTRFKILTSLFGPDGTGRTRTETFILTSDRTGFGLENSSPRGSLMMIFWERPCLLWHSIVQNADRITQNTICIKHLKFFS